MPLSNVSSSDINAELERKRAMARIRKQRWREKKKQAKITETKDFVKKSLEQPETEKPKRRIRFRLHRPKPAKVLETPVAETPDVTSEQEELPMTTLSSPEAISKEKLSEVKKNPERYLEVNVLQKSRVVDSFYIPVDKKKFHYSNKEYNVEEDAIYLLPTRSGRFIPTSFYKEGDNKPKNFKNNNKGITGKALSLLYMEQLYTSLLYSEDTKYNFFIVILSIGILIAYAIGIYFVFFHGGGMINPEPTQPVPIKPNVPLPEMLIRFKWW